MASTEPARLIGRPAKLALALAPLLVAGALAGCETTSSTSPSARAAASNAPVDPMAAFAWSAAPGGNTLNGVVAYRPQRAQRWSCDQQSVALMPAAPASRERVEALYGSDTFAVRPVSEVRVKSGTAGPVTFAAFVKETTCAPDGRFVFDHLADGDWYIVARAKRVQPRAAKDDEGVAIVQRVTLRGGKAEEIKVPAF